MSLNDYLKCPGLDKTLSVVPLELKCHQCHTVVEVWSDEIKRRCSECKQIIYNPAPLIAGTEPQPENKNLIEQEKLDELLDLAISLGCDDAAIVQTDDIVIDPELAGLCLETHCQNYGLSPTCPPHIEGPKWIENYLKETTHALFLKIEVNDEVLYSDQRRETGKLLHFIVVQIEKAAYKSGLKKSRAFAGGSCKNIFCSDHYYCEVIENKGECRNPDSARPSVSGYGISIKHLIKIAGWSPKKQDKEKPDVSNNRYGLIILGR